MIRLSPNQKLAILLVAIAIPTGVATYQKLTAHDDPHGRRGQSSLLGLFNETPESLIGLDDDERPDSLQRFALEQEEARAKEQEKKLEADTIQRVSIASVIGTTAGAMPRDEDLAALDGSIANVHGGGGEITVDFTDGHDVRKMIDDAWGPSPDGKWMDTTNHVRAMVTVDGVGTHVTWRRISTPDQLIAALDLDSGSQVQAMDPLGWSENPIFLDVTTGAGGAPTRMIVHTSAPDESGNVLEALRAAFGDGATASDGSQTWRHGKQVIRATAPPEGVVIDVTRARR